MSTDGGAGNRNAAKVSFKKPSDEVLSPEGPWQKDVCLHLALLRAVARGYISIWTSFIRGTVYITNMDSLIRSVKFLFINRQQPMLPSNSYLFIRTRAELYILQCAVNENSRLAKCVSSNRRGIVMQRLLVVKIK